MSSVLGQIVDHFSKYFLYFSVKNPRPAIDIRNRPRIPVPDEDPYSIAGSGSSGSSGNGNRERSRDKPPKLPPRDNSIYATGGLGKVKVRDIWTSGLLFTVWKCLWIERLFRLSFFFSFGFSNNLVKFWIENILLAK